MRTCLKLTNDCEVITKEFYSLIIFKKVRKLDHFNKMQESMNCELQDTLQNIVKKPYSTYSLNCRIGGGGFGEVYNATETDSGKAYAIKCCKHIFIKDRHCRSILRELIFGRLLDHPLIMKIREVLIPTSFKTFNAIWFVYDLMDMDLRNLMESEMKLSLPDIQYIMFQMLNGVKYLHDVGVIHRDIKPENILINSDFSLKISDFGLSCLAKKDRVLTEYTVTRWYRAPEILLECGYDEAVDVWSIGCILGEMLTKQVLFKGRNRIHQIEQIAHLLGVPSDLSYISNHLSREYLKNLETNPQWQKMFYEYDIQAVDLLTHLLVWDPKKRYSAVEALNHPFIKSMNPEMIRGNLTPRCFPNIDFGFDENNLSLYELKDRIIEEIMLYHPNLKIPIDN